MLKIGSKNIGDDYPTFITFEAGPTHNGFQSAKDLIKIAAENGGDAVKFQIFDPDELVHDKSLLYSYDILDDAAPGGIRTVSEPLYDIFVRRSMRESEWKELKSYADQLGIVFFATIGDEAGLEIVKAIDCESIKIASADVNHLPWLREISKYDLVVQLDTGNSTFGEIETAVDVIRGSGSKRVIIHNCPSGYPAHLDSINLRMIPSLKSLFNCPVAYSDHSAGSMMDIAAVALGANLVEKTITQDKYTPSVEHIMSLEPHEVANFVTEIRTLERAMGSSRRIMSDEEKSKRLNVRRSVFLDEDVEAGQCLKNAKVKFKRPGYGISPDQYENYLDKSFIRSVTAGSLLDLDDLS